MSHFSLTSPPFSSFFFPLGTFSLHFSCCICHNSPFPPLSPHFPLFPPISPHLPPFPPNFCPFPCIFPISPIFPCPAGEWETSGNGDFQGLCSSGVYFLWDLKPGAGGIHVHGVTPKRVGRIPVAAHLGDSLHRRLGGRWVGSRWTRVRHQCCCNLEHSLSTGKLTYQGIVAPRMGLHAVVMYVVIRVIFVAVIAQKKKLLPLCILFFR